MNITLGLTLTQTQKDSLQVWLCQVFESEKLESAERFPFADGYMGLYFDGRVRLIYRGDWTTDSNYLYLARPNTEVEPKERLAVLLTLVQLCDQSEELVSAASGAITRYLLGEYQSLSSSLVSAPTQPLGIAFSTDNRSASLFNTVWMLPSGEEVDVSGPEWTVCATAVPRVLGEITAEEEFV